MRLLAVGLLAALAALARPVSVAAQERVCEFSTTGRTVQSETEPDVIIVYDPFVVTCDDGVRVSANSGRHNQSTGETYLSGDVYFEDPEQLLTAREATYYAATAYLDARGDVVFENRTDGSTLRGPSLEYFRATEERPVAQMNASGRPNLTFLPAEADDGEPIDLVADRVTVLGEDDLSAFGGVIITRTDLTATSGEARHNSTTGALELRESVVVRTEEYDLSAEVVRTRLVEGALEYLNAYTDAELRGDDLEVVGNEVRISFDGENVERAIALAGGEPEPRRAVATSASFRLEADSLDAAFIDQRLDRVDAIGEARGESIDTTAAPIALAPVDSVPLAVGDTVPPITEPDSVADPAASAFRSDWIRGDTIIGYFVERIPEDAALEADPGRVEADVDGEAAVDLERLVAIGNAQSLYRLAGQGDQPGERRNLNFLVGERIDLTVADGELRVAEVTGLQYGMYLEPESTTAVENGPATDPGADAAPAPNADGS